MYLPADTGAEAAWTPLTQAVITVPSEAGEHELGRAGRGVPVGVNVGKGVLVGIGAVEVLKSPPVNVVNAVALGE